MLERRFHLEVRTSQKLVYEGEVSSIKAPGALGSFEILSGHIPFLTMLRTGEICIRESETVQSIATSGGVLEVLRTGVTVLADTAEWGHEIDVERAEGARQRAEDLLASHGKNSDRLSAETALARASNRLKIANQHR